MRGEHPEELQLAEARKGPSPARGTVEEQRSQHLLLQSTLNRGKGFFGKVSFVQRLATSGGVAPTRACADGETEGVKYRAQYRFFAPTGS